MYQNNHKIFSKSYYKEFKMFKSKSEMYRNQFRTVLEVKL